MIKLLKELLHYFLYGPTVRPHVRELGEFLIENAQYLQTTEYGALWFDFNSVKLTTTDTAFWRKANMEGYRIIMDRNMRFNKAEEDYLDSVVVKIAMARMTKMVEIEEESKNAKRQKEV